MHRIQKLLHRDFKSIPDVILLESAFAETNKKGKGVRQVYLALSAQNLFIAIDDVGRICNDVSGRERNYTTFKPVGENKNYNEAGATNGNDRNPDERDTNYESFYTSSPIGKERNYNRSYTISAPVRIQRNCNISSNTSCTRIDKEIYSKDRYNTSVPGRQGRNYTSTSSTVFRKVRKYSNIFKVNTLNARKGNFSTPGGRAKNYATRAAYDRSNNYNSELVDPVIETLELTSMFPLDCVCLHIYRERTRNTIKLYTAQNPDRARYFELGGCGYLGNRAKLWTLWQDKIKHLNSTGFENTLSVHSETSVGTSVSKSTAYPVYLDMLGCSNVCQGRSVWKEEVFCDSGHVHVVDTARVRQMDVVDKEYTTSNSDFYHLVEESVTLWENASSDKSIGLSRKKCFPYPNFCYGFGTIRVSRQEKHLLFVRKTKSLITLDRYGNHSDNQEPEFQQPIPKKHLTGTISHLSLTHPLRGNTPRSPLFWTTQLSRSISPNKCYHTYLHLRNEWNSETPSCGKKCKPYGLWRKFKNMATLSKIKLSTSVSAVEDEKCEKPQNAGMNLIGNHSKIEENQSISGNNKCNTERNVEKSTEESVRYSTELASNIQNIHKAFRIDHYKLPINDTEQLFRIKHQVNISDCDIEAVACQLTLLEASLLTVIPIEELVLLANEKSTENTPHIRHTLWFAQRLSSLVSTEVISTIESIPVRARTVAKFILIAHACVKHHNYQSTLSILHGLQSPPVYRLTQTWAYVRKYHARKYRLYSRMSTDFHDPVDPNFINTISETIDRKISENAYGETTGPRFVLPIRYILATLVGRVPHGSWYEQFGNNARRLLEMAVIQTRMSRQLNNTGLPIHNTTLPIRNTLFRPVRPLRDCLHNTMFACEQYSLYSAHSNTAEFPSDQYANHIHSNYTVLPSEQYSKEIHSTYNKRRCQHNTAHRKSRLSISQYRNIVRAVELLMLSHVGAQACSIKLDSSETLEYLTKKQYRTDWGNFVLSKKLE